MARLWRDYGAIFKNEPMGNLKSQSWDEIWNSEQARAVRKAVRECKKNCWMIGSAAPAMYAHPWGPIAWVLRSKFTSKKAR